MQNHTDAEIYSHCTPVCLLFTLPAATKAWSTSTAWSARTECLCTTCCWRCWMLTTSTAPSDQLSPCPRLTESIPLPQATTTTTAAAAVVAMAVDLLQLAPVQDPEAATRAQAETPQVQVSCSTEGPSPTALTSYEKAFWEWNIQVQYLNSFHEMIIYKLHDFFVCFFVADFVAENLCTAPVHYSLSLNAVDLLCCLSKYLWFWLSL